MPITQTDKGWYWGSKGPFDTKSQAQAVARAAHANGFHETQGESDVITVQDFVLCLLHSVTNAHILHLQSLSYSEHKALEGFYKEIGDRVDEYVEAYQGKYGLIMGYGEEYNAPPPALEYLIGLNDYVYMARQQLPQDTELQNITDEIASLIDSTIYKLRFLQ